MKRLGLVAILVAIGWMTESLLLNARSAVADPPAAKDSKPANPDVKPVGQQHEAANAPAKDSKPSDGATATTKKRAKKADGGKGGKLPAYIRDVIDDQGREKAMAIEKEYGEKIASLRAQVLALTKERDEKILALLTSEQKEKMDQLKVAAKSERSNARKKRGTLDDQPHADKPVADKAAADKTSADKGEKTSPCCPLSAEKKCPGSDTCPLKEDKKSEKKEEKKEEKKTDKNK